MESPTKRGGFMKEPFSKTVTSSLKSRIEPPAKI